MILQSYFTYLRNRSSLGKDRKTIRMLESLIRLAEAHARLMHKNDIDIYDAVCVIILMEHCVCTGLYDELPPVIMSKQIYEKAKYETLSKLGLTDFSYFEDEFDSIISHDAGFTGRERLNNMNDDTAFILETNFDNDKTDMTHLNTQKTRRRVGIDDTVAMLDSQVSVHS